MGFECIFAEMYRKGKPLFPGPKSYKRQLMLIFSIVGKPKSFDWIENPRALKFMKTLKPTDPIPIQVLCPGICNEGADLLSRMLEPNPNERISLADALSHPFVSTFRDPSTELECDLFDIAYEKDPRIKSKRGLRMMLYETVNEWLNGPAVSKRDQKG
jgi:serine/threonine protein kinase